MAHYTVVFDRDARADLETIRDHIANARGAEFADAFIDRVITYCEKASGQFRIVEPNARPFVRV